ncbi:MAG: YbjN domain-containing protein [Oscillospiraceae bacterium]|nr:YbjN domain-containing protein [Oscillospiraceae bacterium]
MNNTQAVKAFFEENQWEFNEQDGCFESGVSLNGDIEGALLQVDANNGGIVVLAGLDYDVPSETTMEVLELCNLVNMLLPTGALFLDVSERIVVCRLGQYYGEGKAEANDVGEQVTFCLDMIEKVAAVITGLTEGDLTPDEAAEQMLRPAE